MLTRNEVADFADSVRLLLADGDTALTTSTRLRWEGALAALEAVLGEAPSQIDTEIASDVRFCL